MDYEKSKIFAPVEQIKKLEDENRQLRFKLEAFENHILSNTELEREDLLRIFESEIANDCLCWKAQAETRQELLNDNDKEISEKDALIIKMTEEINQLKATEKAKEKQYQAAAIKEIQDVVKGLAEAKASALGHLAAALNELAKIH